MKKTLFLLLLATISLNNVMGAQITRMGKIILRSVTTDTDFGPVVSTRPPINPFSGPTEAFTLYADYTCLEITSVSVNANVDIWIEGEYAIVYSESVVMGAGSEVFIPVADLPAGAYTLYIMYSDEVLVGEFEVE